MTQEKRDYNDLVNLLNQMERLFRISRHPRSDPAFAYYRPDLEEWRDWMTLRLRTLGSDQQWEFEFIQAELKKVVRMLGA